MKRILIFIIIMVIVLAFAGCVSPDDGEPVVEETSSTKKTESTEVTEATEETRNHDFGAKSALEKDEYTVEEMLEYAIQDEYLARQEYELIMDEYGEQKPFSNIIKAEKKHIEMMKEIYETYGYDIPEDDAIDHAVLPESLEVAFDIGVQAEIDNIAMYEKFLESELPEDIRSVFVELKEGSENHLEAFEKGPRGNGNGQGKKE